MNVPRRRSGRAALAAAMLLALPGCTLLSAVSATLFQPRLRECEGFDVPLGTLPGSSRKELRVRLVGRRLDQDIPFVVETTPKSFVIVAFTPLGTKAFTLVRRDDAKAEVQSFMGPVLAVPPANIMADLLAMSVPGSCLSAPDGVAVSTAGAWQVSDTCKDERAVERRLSRPGKDPEVEVFYLGDSIVVTQKACRYTARYMFQGGPPPAEPDDFSDEDEGSAPPR